MRTIYLTLLLILALSPRSWGAVKPIWCETYGEVAGVAALPDAVHALDMAAFLKLTPAKYRKLTGRSLSVKEALALKAAQKQVRKASRQPGDVPELAYIILALFGFAWVAMGVMSNWSGSDWIINLILSFCCCLLPGLIHALVRMPYYYGGIAR